jgi:fumarate hydratase subunit alpha
MAIGYQALKSLATSLYDHSLRKVPENTLDAMRRALETESSAIAAETLKMQLASAALAERTDRFVCSDSGVPVYIVRIGTRVQFEGDVKRAIKDSFADLVARIEPPILKHVTNPLTNERDHHGKDIPAISWDIIDGADYVEIVCAPKALGSGRWGAMQIFSFPELAEIEAYILDVAIKAGSQHCPPVIIGVGIGGDFDMTTRMAKMATLRPIGSRNDEPILASMEERLLKAVNATGFGPMGTGGDTTALAVHVDYAAGHGYTPVAVAFNCWISRKSGARLYDDGRIEWLEDA